MSKKLKEISGEIYVPKMTMQLFHSVAVCPYRLQGGVPLTFCRIDEERDCQLDCRHRTCMQCIEGLRRRGERGEREERQEKKYSPGQYPIASCEG